MYVRENDQHNGEGSNHYQKYSKTNSNANNLSIGQSWLGHRCISRLYCGCSTIKPESSNVYVVDSHYGWVCGDDIILIDKNKAKNNSGSIFGAVILKY